MTVRQAYRSTLAELQCIRNRASHSCDFKCESCPCFCDPRNQVEAMQFNISLLKAKDPMLYLADDLAELKEVLKSYVESKNQETE